MREPVTGVLRVEADMRVEVDGAVITLTGSGQHLRMDTAAPVTVWSAMSSAALPSGLGRVNGPRGLGHLADALAQQGLDLQVHGLSGELARLGAGASSTWGRALTGSRHVRLGGVGALAPLATAWFRQSKATRAVLVGVAASAIAGVAVARVRRSVVLGASAASND